MFGKTKEFDDIEGHTHDGVSMDEFFGDEAGVAESVRVDQLQQRVTQVEQQINSQFTSLAAYAQIAQEQVELVRSEAQHGKERSEQRVIELIERERADRISSSPGSSINVTERLDALDAQVGEIREGLQQCLSNQRALADAITDLFAPITEAPAPTPAPVPAAPSAPVADAHTLPTPAPVSPETLPPPPPHDSPGAPDAPEAHDAPETHDVPEAHDAPIPAPAAMVGFDPPVAAGDTAFGDMAFGDTAFSDTAPDAEIVLDAPEHNISPIEPVEVPDVGLVNSPIDGLSLN